MARQALFEGLVYDESGNPVTTAYIGGEAHYVVEMDGFHRHIASEEVDRPILSLFIEQLQANQDIAVQQALNFIGRDDLFTKAAIDASIRNVSPDQILEQGIPPQARDMMGMSGFRITINHHGEIVNMNQPTAPDEE